MKKSFIFLFLFLAIFSLIIGSWLFFTKKGGIYLENETVQTMQEQEMPPFVPQDLNLVALGDSLTEGVGDSTDSGGYIPYLQALLEAEKEINKTTFSNFGVAGSGSDQLLKSVQTEEVKTAVQEADLVIVTIGGNDMMKVVQENLTSLNKVDFEEQKGLFEKNLHSMIKTIRQENVDSYIVLVGLYNPFNQWFPDIKEMNEVVNEWNEGSQKVLFQYSNTHFVDIMKVFENAEENLLYTDYFHPNNKGYEIIAQEVFLELAGNNLKQLVEQKYYVQKEEENN
jgi:lysophospholipase L1-like esterase